MTNEFKVGGYGEVIHEMTEAKMQNMGQYAHINEPVHHVIYLYDVLWPALENAEVGTRGDGQTLQARTGRLAG